MVSMADVYSAIEETNANLVIWNHPLLDALTLEMNRNYDIFINPEKSKTISAFQTKLIHEWGHCSTGSTHHINSPFELIEKNEFKANRASFERFLPFADIKKAVNEGLTEYWELAEYFNIEEEYIRQAIHYYLDLKQLKF